jgi:glycosyltransferase involved in cell wall biosynthesis
MVAERLIFQLGTNNWQRGGEFAPGSGILHEAHHKAFNALPNVESYSVYPSKRQRFSAPDVRVFELDHDIPICESISPVSSHRWHGMSDEEIAGYRRRLTRLAIDWMEEIETQTNKYFSLAIAHHTFLNPLIMRDVIESRVAAGRPSMPLVCFVHGTALKMYTNERSGVNPEEYPLRFFPMIEEDGIFDDRGDESSVDLFAAISAEQVAALTDIFPSIAADRVALSPNGYNHDVFRVINAPNNVFAERQSILSSFRSTSYEGSPHPSRFVDSDVDAVVLFCGKFADWKRLEALLHAAAIYERGAKRVATLIVGTGPLEDQKRLQTLAYDELRLQRAFFLGPRSQDELAILFNAADVGCFPSYKEPFGLVFIECMACGTPVIGANSGGPRDFVTADVGHLVTESDDQRVLSASLADAITKAIDENWKLTKGPVAARYAASNYSVSKQVSGLLAEIDRRCPPTNE